MNGMKETKYTVLYLPGQPLYASHLLLLGKDLNDRIFDVHKWSINGLLACGKVVYVCVSTIEHEASVEMNAET